MSGGGELSLAGALFNPKSTINNHTSIALCFSVTSVASFLSSSPGRCSHLLLRCRINRCIHIIHRLLFVFNTNIYCPHNFSVSGDRASLTHCPRKGYTNRRQRQLGSTHRFFFGTRIDTKEIEPRRTQRGAEGNPADTERNGTARYAQCEKGVPKSSFSRGPRISRLPRYFPKTQDAMPSRCP